jgi:NADH dehydrogenase/NADH:ubiquinone oxidoreductase subunit G
MINLDLNKISNLKKITESRLINYNSSKKLYNEKLLMNQSFKISSFSNFFNFKKYLYLPNNIFFENQESFINAEGLIKRTTKLITRKNIKNDWQLLRKFVKTLSLNFNFSNVKNNFIVYYNSKTLFNFKNFLSFQFHAIQTLTNLSLYLYLKNEKFVIYKKFNVFKTGSIKLFNTKLKYWLDDFYIDGKELFCQNSLTLTRCSINYRTQVSTFF